MNKNAAILGMLMTFIFCVTPPASGQESISNPNEIMDLQWEIGSWTDLWRIGQFESIAADSKVSFYIYLPPGYESGTKRYPVLYWLHGSYDRPYTATPVVKRLDAAIRAGRATEMIVVSCLDPTGVSMWTDSKDGRLPIETVIVNELIPYVDSVYRTVPDRQGRAIEGFSMGGYGAAYLGVKYDDLFSSISMLSSALHTPETFKERRRAIYKNVFGGDPDYASERSPWKIVERKTDAIRNKTSMRVFVGAEDFLLDWNQKYHQLLKDLGVEHEWGVVPKSPHDLETLLEYWEGDFFAYYKRVFADLN